MARQTGVVKISGTLGDISFYKTRWGYFARSKSSLSGKRVKREKNFARTMENAREFTSAIQSGKILRDAIRHLLKGASDSYLSARMNGLFSGIQKTDVVSQRGKRHAAVALQHAEGKVLLKGFEFNRDCFLIQLIRKRPEISGDEITIYGLNLLRDISWPKGASGAELKACITDIDFGHKKFIRYNTNTVYLVRGAGTTDITMTAGVLPTPSSNRLYILRCSFFHEKNGVKYFLKDKKYNCLHILSAA